MSASEPFRRCAAVFVALLATILSSTAAAQPIVTDEDIARARRDTPIVTDDDIRRAQEKHSAPSPVPPPAPSTPRIEALPEPLTARPLDLSAVAQGYADGAARLDGAQALAGGPALLVFASLSMPEATLARLLEQAERAHALIVLRGFMNGSLRDTAARVQRLIGGRQAAVQIDPLAFDRFAVTRVPSFVLVRDGTRPAACAGGACPPAGAFARTAGDVSLDYALAHLRRAAPDFQREADLFLARLKPRQP
ncbi:type-F conjugative transfer system pilin assembly protein TrbC [Pseudothauera nasutitermitis]|uniref:type-F conjugative transfer system pilin assembly protein TrbC n=1 Tax=Pseudothauera nasutitermitis TaxID=2565930 RepID=UPI001E5CEF75|nr:type-F conjugative transfer system pilin assembly protein TrbC [Pseudothauera nasutitermitis]